jgi:putative ABC transport system substrate-binding protein
MHKLALALLLAAMVPCLAAAQQPDNVRRVAQLMPGPAECAWPLEAAKGTPWEGQGLHPFADIRFRLDLREAGWIEARNIAFERHCFPSADRLADAVATIAGGNFDVIVVWSPQATDALLRTVRVTPVVFVTVGADPVAAGYVQSLGHPGGNATGMSGMGDELTAKRVELTRELFPAARSLAVLRDSKEAAAAGYTIAAASAGARLGIAVSDLPIDRIEALDDLFVAPGARPDMLMVAGSSGLMYANRERIMRWARERGIPTTCTLTDYANVGCLASYSASLEGLSRRATRLVDRILRGAKPADLPVEQPTRFELVINLKTARALGIAVPPALLARADEVIE